MVRPAVFFKSLASSGDFVYACKAMSATRLPVGLRKYIRKQKEKIRHQEVSEQEAEIKIRQFLNTIIKKNKG